MFDFEKFSKELEAIGNCKYSNGTGDTVKERTGMMQYMFIPKCWTCLNRNSSCEWETRTANANHIGFDGNADPEYDNGFSGVTKEDGIVTHKQRKVPVTQFCHIGCGEREYHGFQEHYQEADHITYDGRFEIEESNNVWVADDTQFPKDCENCDANALCDYKYEHCPLKHGQLAVKRFPVKFKPIHPTGWYWNHDEKQYHCRWWIDQRVVMQQLKYPMLFNYSKLLLVIDAFQRYSGRTRHLRLENFWRSLDKINIKCNNDDRTGVPVQVHSPKLYNKIVEEMRILWKGGTVELHHPDLVHNGSLRMAPAPSASRCHTEREDVLEDTGCATLMGPDDLAHLPGLPNWVHGGRIQDPQALLEEQEEMVKEQG